MNPKVSIIVPIYKVPEQLLRTCINSLVNQTLKEIEIILVDDGSPDHCGAICDEFQKKDVRIKVIHKKNQGLSAARNTGFYVSTGEYITFVDGDDWLDADACELAYRTAIKEDVQLVFWNQITEYPHSSEVVISIPGESRLYDAAACKSLQARVLDFNGKIAQAFSKLIKRNYLLENQIIHHEALKQGAEGIVFNIRLFEKLDSAYYLNVPLYHYVYHDESISHTHNEENHYLVIKCFEEIRRMIQKNPNRALLLTNFYNRLLYVIVTTAITGYFNPDNIEPYSEKVFKFKAYLNHPLIDKTMRETDRRGLSNQRKFILKLIDFRLFRIILVLGKLRKKQLISK